MADVDKKKAAGYILWIADGERRVEQPGGFFEKLIMAAFHADLSNLALIESAFPNTGRAMRLYKHQDDGIDILREEAGVSRDESSRT